MGTLFDLVDKVRLEDVNLIGKHSSNDLKSIVRVNGYPEVKIEYCSAYISE